MLSALEILGTVAFAVSGAMVAIDKKMDILGVAILGMTTAVGGGIVRDVIIGVTPPVAFSNPLYALLAIAVSCVVFLPFIRRHVNPDSMLFVIVDAIGLGTFAVIGVISGLPFGNLFLEIFLGTLTGVGGGILRDVFAAEKPMVFVKHFYASACIIGAVLCAVIYPYSRNIAMLTGIVSVIVLRILAARYKWHLPKA